MALLLGQQRLFLVLLANSLISIQIFRNNEKKPNKQKILLRSYMNEMRMRKSKKLGRTHCGQKYAKENWFSASEKAPLKPLSLMKVSWLHRGLSRESEEIKFLSFQ